MCLDFEVEDTQSNVPSASSATQNSFFSSISMVWIRGNSEAYSFLLPTLFTVSLPIGKKYFPHSFTNILPWVHYICVSFSHQKISRENSHLLLQVPGPWPQTRFPPNPRRQAAYGLHTLASSVIVLGDLVAVCCDLEEASLGIFPIITLNLCLSSGPHLWSLLELHCSYTVLSSTGWSRPLACLWTWCVARNLPGD